MGDELRTTKPWLPTLPRVTGEPLECSDTVHFRASLSDTKPGKKLWNDCLESTSQIYPCLFLLIVSRPCSIEKSETEEFLNSNPSNKRTPGGGGETRKRIISKWLLTF